MPDVKSNITINFSFSHNHRSDDNWTRKIIGSIENAMIFEYITDEPVLSKMYIYNANFSI